MSDRGSPAPNGRTARSSSPAVKRSAAQIEGGAATAGTDQDVDMKENQEPNARPDHRRAASVDMMEGEGRDTSGTRDTSSAGFPSDSRNIFPAPSSMARYTASESTRRSSQSHEPHVSSHELPSIDEQVEQVTQFTMSPLRENQKGYVISSTWLRRVLARSSSPQAAKADKTATEGEIGPVDNSDLVLVTDPATGFKDEKGEPFVPLRPGLQMGEDFEVIPEEGWDLIMKWYGLADQSPAIVRYAHNTAVGADSENIQYELNPPVFTILKLLNPAAGTTPQTLREKNMSPVRILASRHTNVQKWLKGAKELAHIDMSTKVRVWRILGGLASANPSAAITPAVSRSASPAPPNASAVVSTVASAGNSLVLDVNTFLSLREGAQRELVEDVKDQTANPNYNGRATLDVVGLGGSDVIVLEERVGGINGDWVSAASKNTLNRLGVPTGPMATGTVSKVKTNKSPTASGRSSPVPEPLRGRRKDGKPRGCTGLSNLGNTCYMNSALQCVRSTKELTYYFLNDVYKRDLNPSNPLAHNGDVAKAYANLLRMIYDASGNSSFAPRQLKQTIGRYGPAFSGYGQQDSQEFLLFLLDGLQEDLNRIHKKPYIEKPDSTDEMVHDKKALAEFADKCWDIYKARNDSVITDLFAGMYKSTLVCPECEKVSIIFDPFNNLTLQLPVENLWNREIFYFPLHKKPVLVDVEIDKNASVKALKEFVAAKTGSDPQRLIMAEVYKSKFYRMFDNSSSIAECQITSGDDIVIIEVESVPTNYNPDKRKKGFPMLSFSSMDHEEAPSFDSPKADRLLVPIFHRISKPKNANRYAQRPLFGVPSFVVIAREEAGDYDAILRKVLAQVDTMTTRDIFNENWEHGVSRSEDSDTVVMDEDDAESDSKIKTSSVEGEDGLVDVSMRDADDDQRGAAAAAEQSTRRSPSSNQPIPPGLRHLFDMKLVQSNEAIPLGFSSVDESKIYPSMSARLEKFKSRTQGKTKKAKKGRVVPAQISPASSDDELAAPGVTVGMNRSKPVDDSEEDDQSASRAGSGSDSDTDGYTSVDRSDEAETRPSVPSEPLIRPGEGIVLDWTEEAHDALFGGDPKEREPLRGVPTWTNVERVPDPELTQRRALRQSRKKRGITLSECLDEFNKEEILSENDAWYCPRCKEHRRASKKFELWKTPDILVMHLKRFSANRGFRDKIDVLVDFPVEGLDLTGRVESPEKDKSLVYDLFAVDNHYGGLGGGHYTAFAKNFINDEWYEYNDSSVSKVSDPRRVVTPAAYLLFYRRRSDRPLGGKILEEIAESSSKSLHDTDSQPGSRGQSPSGEGKRLGGPSRNGSSSALTGVGAAHQAGDGGLLAGIRARNGREDDDDDDGANSDLDVDDEPPPYSNDLASGERRLARGMDVDAETDDLDDGRGGTGLLPMAHEPAWSFSRIPDTHGSSPQMTAEQLPGSYFDGHIRNADGDDGDDDDEDLFDDAASNQAVGGGDLSDTDLRLSALAGDDGEGDGPGAPAEYPGTPLDEDTLIQDVPPLQQGDEDEDDLPVVELRVNDEEEKMVSD